MKAIQKLILKSGSTFKEDRSHQVGKREPLNMNLKREICDLKRQLAETLDERAGEVSIARVDSLKSTQSLAYQQGGDYVTTEKIHSRESFQGICCWIWT